MANIITVAAITLTIIVVAILVWKGTERIIRRVQERTRLKHEVNIRMALGNNLKHL
jgi:uncharacterized membrane protein YidH (DUF202 family)